MPDDLPPLNALRAFAAAGRHRSISRAAQELHVTPAAVSHQVKALEEYLGTPLFRRRSNRLELTDAGEALLPGLTDGFTALQLAVDSLRTHDRHGALVLSVAPVFAAKWLIPRLPGFQARHPEIDVRVSASLELADFERDGVDAAVRVGRGHYDGLISDRLFGEAVAPMCSPALLERDQPLARPEDLRHHVLLHFDWPGGETVVPDWEIWLRARSVGGVDASHGPRFTQPDYAMQAAVEGAGVVLGWRTLAEADLNAGRLVMPFEGTMPADVAFHLVYPEAGLQRSKLMAFREWLLEESRRQSNP